MIGRHHARLLQSADAIAFAGAVDPIGDRYGAVGDSRVGANLARQEMGCMLEALLDILPPGSRFLRDEVEFTSFAFFKRPVTLPVEIAR